MGIEEESDEYYDDEDDYDGESDEQSEGEYMTPQEEEEERKREEEEKKVEEEKRAEKDRINNEIYGDPGSGYEWSSNVDSNGKQVKKEGEDEEDEEEEWYYAEDKEAFERGESNIPPLLNPNPISDDNYDQVEYDQNRVKMLQSA